MKTTDNISHLAHEAADRITSASSQAADTFDEKSEQFINAEQKLVKKCRGYVRDNPVASLGIAVAGGFLLSRLLSGR